MAKHKSGGKITANHSSLIDAAFPIVEAAEKLPEVNKIDIAGIYQADWQEPRHYADKILAHRGRLETHGERELYLTRDFYLYRRGCQNKDLPANQVWLST